MKKKLIAVLLALRMVCAVFAGTALAEGGAALLHLEFYRARMYMGIDYEIDANGEGDAFVKIVDGPEETVLPADPGFIEDVEALLEEYRVCAWNGFRGVDRYALDGESFSLGLTYADGSTVTASGSNMFPDGYFAFSGALDGLVQPYIDRYRDSKVPRIIEDEDIVYFSLYFSADDEEYRSACFDVTILLNGYEGKTYFTAEISAACFDVPEYVQDNMVKRGSGPWYCVYMPLDEAPFGELQDVLRKRDAVQWNGLDYSSADDSEGPEYRLYVMYSSGEWISVMGRGLPEGFTAMCDELAEAIIRYINALWEEAGA